MRLKNAESMQEPENTGFTTISRVLGENEVNRLLEVLGCQQSGRSRAGERHLLGKSAIRSLAHDPRLLEISSSLLGHRAFPFRATLFDKSGDRNWLVVWHQDTALPIRQRREVPGWGPWSTKAGVAYAHAPTHALAEIVALRVHLDESSAMNGPLRVLPGTHRLGVLSDNDVQALSRQIAPVECLVGHGGIVAMRPLLIHSSSKSASGAPLRIIHIEYASRFELGNDLELAVA